MMSLSFSSRSCAKMFRIINLSLIWTLENLETDLAKILYTDQSDTIKNQKSELSFKDLDQILLIDLKIPRSCLQDVSLG